MLNTPNLCHGCACVILLFAAWVSVLLKDSSHCSGFPQTCDVETPVEAHFGSTFVLSREDTKVRVRARHLCQTSLRCSLLSPPRALSGKNENYARNCGLSRTSLPREVQKLSQPGSRLCGRRHLFFWGGDYGVFARAAEQSLNPAHRGHIPVIASSHVDASNRCVPELF